MNQHMVTALCSLHKVTLTIFFLLINLLPTVDTDASALLTTKLATGHNPEDLILTSVTCKVRVKLLLYLAKHHAIQASKGTGV